MTGGYRKIKLLSLMVALVVTGLAVVGGTWATGALYEGTGKDVPEGTAYNVDLTYYNGEEYVPTSGEGVQYFGTDWWYPGKTQIVYLKVENHEEFPVTATVALNVGTSTFDSNVMEYAFYVARAPLHESASPSNWSEFKNEATSKGGALEQNQSYDMIKQEELKGGDNVRYIALAIHMNENASNSNQNPSMELGFSLQIDSLFDPYGTPDPNDSTGNENNSDNA